MPELPTGTVTFLFTDVEGSTRLLQRIGDAYRDLLAIHDRTLREAIASGGGIEVQTEGDGFFVAFPTATGAVVTATEAQRNLLKQEWPEGEAVRVRMGAHTGEGILSDGDYVGLDVHRAARIAAAAHGGQVLVSDATRALIEHALPKGIDLRDLGAHRLKDIEQPEHLHQLRIAGLPDAFPPIRSLDAQLTNLPTERSSFIGREDELAEVSTLLDQVRLLTLTGPGGIGKTRMALKLGAKQVGRFADGVYLADLSPITDPGLVPGVIARALMLREEPGRDALDSLADHLQDRELLLVLDNVEQVVEAASMVRRLIDAAPGLKVLATSRIPLHLTGEQEFSVPPLRLPDANSSSDPESIAGNEAVQLFVHRAAAVRPGMELTADNAATLVDIAIKLDGLPLAIELAASRAKALAPDTILAHLGTRLSIETGALDRPERQRTLRRTIEWSHDLLDPEHQRLFTRLATFRGGCTLAAAEAVCGPGLDLDVIDGITALVDHSLVRPVEVGESEPRFTMLETIRQYAAERLAQSRERDALERRHAEYYQHVAEESEPRLTREDRVVWLDRLEADSDNLRTAIDWAERSGDAATGLRIATAIWRFWQQRGRLSEGRAYLERLLTMSSAQVRGPLRVRALGALGGIAYWQNDRPLIRASYEEAVEIARESKDPRLLASALYDLSFVPLMDQDVDRAGSLLQEGLAAAEEAGDRLLKADYWDSLAFLETARGNPKAGIPMRRRVIEIYREAGEEWKLANALTGLAMMSRMAGDREAPKGHLHEALRIFARAGDATSVSMVLTGSALLANDDGLPERAARLIGASARIRDELGGGIPPELSGRWGDPASDAKKTLGQDAYDAARAEGYAMDTEAAVAYGMEDGG